LMFFICCLSFNETPAIVPPVPADITKQSIYLLV